MAKAEKPRIVLNLKDETRALLNDILDNIPQADMDAKTAEATSRVRDLSAKIAASAMPEEAKNIELNSVRKMYERRLKEQDRVSDEDRVRSTLVKLAGERQYSGESVFSEPAGFDNTFTAAYAKNDALTTLQQIIRFEEGQRFDRLRHSKKHPPLFEFRQNINPPMDTAAEKLMLDADPERRQQLKEAAELAMIDIERAFKEVYSKHHASKVSSNKQKAGWVETTETSRKSTQELG